jgi:hypothetical protein
MLIIVSELENRMRYVFIGNIRSQMAKMHRLIAELRGV